MNPPKLVKSEIAIQSEAFQWAWNTYPTTRRLLFHIPNGGVRSKVEAAQLKASGVIAGIPDMMLVWKGRAYGFEFKTTIGVLSPAQREIHQAWTANGTPVWIIRTVEEFKAVFVQIITKE